MALNSLKKVILKIFTCVRAGLYVGWVHQETSGLFEKQWKRWFLSINSVTSKCDRM